MISNLPVFFLLGLFIAGQSSGATPLIEEAALREVGLTTYWRAELPIAENDSVSNAFLVDDAIYVTTESGILFSLTADMGLLRWAEKVGRRGYPIGRPTHLWSGDGRGPVVVPVTGEMLVHDRYSGKFKQSFTPGFSPASAVEGEANLLFIGGAEGRLHALSLNPHGCGGVVQRWDVMAGGAITGKPIVYGAGRVLFASHGGCVFSCSALDKALNWSFFTGGAIVGDPVIDDSGAYISCMDRKVYKIDTGFGRLLWRKRFPAPLAEGPMVTAHTVYQYCPKEGITALDSDTGETRWSNATARRFVSHVRDRDVLFTSFGYMLVVVHESGELLGKFDIHPVHIALSNSVDDSAYFLDPRGRVLCARAEDVPYLRKQQVIAAQRNLRRSPVSEDVKWRSSRDADREDDDRLSDPLRSRDDIRP